MCVQNKWVNFKSKLSIVVKTVCVIAVISRPVKTRRVKQTKNEEKNHRSEKMKDNIIKMTFLIP